MPTRKPIVRHFIACERIELSADGQHYSLLNLIQAIRPLPGAAYPRIHPELALFVLLTDAHGRQPLTLTLVNLDDETSIYNSPSVTLELGQDPLMVYGWPIRLRNILFPRPGLYEFRLLCDGEVIAREPILL